MELPETRQRERLLYIDFYIDFRKRETFAYACEAYSRILEAGSTLGPTRQRSAPLPTAGSRPRIPARRGQSAARPPICGKRS